MNSTAVDEILARRFRIDRPPTLVARKYPRSHIAFSRMRSDHPMRGRSMTVPPAEAAYSFHVPMTVPFFSALWMEGKRKTLPDAKLGDAFLFDLSENPRVGLDTSFDSMRFFVPQAALDEIANEEGIPRIRLNARQFGGRDLVMYGLAQTLAGAMAQPGYPSAMFCDHIALALFAHIVPVYGDLPIDEYARGGLAPWQLRRAYDFIDENLDADPSISEVAEQCGLSSSYFGRAFKRASGLSPHRWLTKRRIERAKELLDKPDIRLAEIAHTCGFVDQSHFSHVFSKSEGCSPGRWRRLRHS